MTEYRVHWGDGTSDTYSEAGEVTHVYADGWADRTITIDLVDEDGTHRDADLAAGPEGVGILRDSGGAWFSAGRLAACFSKLPRRRGLIGKSCWVSGRIGSKGRTGPNTTGIREVLLFGCAMSFRRSNSAARTSWTREVRTP